MGDYMRDETKLLIKKYALLKLKYDFMGYTFKESGDLSFHHLIIPKCECPKLGLDKGYFEWNGAILVKNTAHPYLHIIEKKDRERFDAITDEIIIQKMKGYLDIENIKAIDDILTSFEKEYCGSTNSKGDKLLIRESYTKRMVSENKLILTLKNHIC